MRKNAKIIIVSLALFCFFASLYRLLILRFDKGDVYPPYSSFRSDPLGSRVLYEALRSIPGAKPVRFDEPPEQIGNGRGKVLLYLGEPAWMMKVRDKTFFDSVEQFARDGGLVFIAFLPEHERREDAKDKNQEEKSEKNDDRPDAGNDKGQDKSRKSTPARDKRAKPVMSMKDRWGIDLIYKDTLPPGNSALNTRKVAGNIPSSKFAWPESLLWRSVLSFAAPAPWKTLYQAGGNPVMITRPVGQGRIMVSSESYFFSNEAMLKDRQTAWLCALFDGRSEIIFDEYHFGIARPHAFTELIAKYRLVYLVWSLLAIFVLFIWKNSSSLVPPSEDLSGYGPDAGKILTEKDYFEGIVSLLKRHIPGKKILKTCFEEWEKTSPRAMTVKQRSQKEWDDWTALALDSGPVEGYRLIFKKLTEGTKYERKS